MFRKESILLEEALDAILENIIPCPQGLETNIAYITEHDDTDGELEILSVGISDLGGDVWMTISPDVSELRFRSPSGGGRFPRVRNAILVLMEAIRRENKAREEREKYRQEIKDKVQALKQNGGGE